MLTLIGFALIFLATTAGSAMVYLFRHDIPKRTNAVILGFAAGVMIAASVWSLLIPSIDAAESTFGAWAWVPAAVGFLLGGLFLVLLDHVLPHFHAGTGHEEGPHVKVHKSTRLFLAVTIHNIPEGLAVGLAFGAAAVVVQNLRFQGLSPSAHPGGDFVQAGGNADAAFFRFLLQCRQHP